jgi:4-amino-4-deoxy-L-arabinose transferase-like glycosyltransferase
VTALANKRLGLATLVALTAVQLLVGLDAVPIMRAEIYFMDGARAMVERSDYLVPYFQGEPFFDKPPLTYWLIALAFRVAGFTPEVARWVSAGAAVATVLTTVWLGSLLLNRQAALVGGYILGTTFAFTSFGRLAMSDMLLALFSTLSMGLAVRALRGEHSYGWLAALGGVLGLGFLTKGPIALLLPGLGVLLVAWRQRRQLPQLAGGIAVGVVAFAVCGLSWFVSIGLRLGWEPLEYFFLSENLQRFASAKYHAGQPIWYYGPTYLAEAAPWSLFLPVALWSFWRKSRQTVDPGVALLLGWFGLMVVPLTLSRGKLDYYLLPLYPAISLVLGGFFGSAWSKLDRIWASIVLTLTSVAIAVATLVPTRIPDPWLPSSTLRASISLVAVLIALLLIAIARRPSPDRTFVALALTSAGAFSAVSGIFIPALQSAQPNDAIVADVARERRWAPHAALTYCDDPLLVSRDVLFYDRLAARERCDLWNPATGAPTLLLMHEERRDDLMKIKAVRFVGRYTYLPARTLTLQGLIDGARPSELALLANYPTADPISQRRNRKDRRRAVQERQAGGLAKEKPFP